MSKMFSSMLLGIFCLVVVFCIFLFLTVGVKFVYLAIKQRLKNKTDKTIPPIPPKKQATPRKKIKSIVINPDDVDRIYVKKSS